jgi:hypothetical protein
MPAGTPVQIRLPDEERDALDSYRRQKSNPPSRAQAARELIRVALALKDHANASGTGAHA